MIQKHPIFPNRVRRIPKQFSWVDHRLVRNHFLERFSSQAAALYLFLVTVADAKGLSYYSDNTLKQQLGMQDDAIKHARCELMEVGLIAWKKPIYQILPIAVEPVHTPAPDLYPQETSAEKSRRTNTQLISIKQLLNQVGNNHDRL